MKGSRICAYELSGELSEVKTIGERGIYAVASV